MLSVNSEEDWTADQVADYLGVKRRSVYSFAARLEGFPQPRHIGRTPVWNSGKVKEWRTAHPARHRRDSTA
jgi:predicted DNA-binding transcriptional regulator AlpA